ESERLLLRMWRPEDRDSFAALNADARVMQHFPACLTRAESDALADRATAHFAQHGYGPYAAELRASGEFIGFVGISIPSFEAHFPPGVEIGWPLAARHWNRGLATEGARAVLDEAFRTLGFPQIVSFTVPANLPSRRVMEKIGMTRNPADDFDHPSLPEGH